MDIDEKISEEGLGGTIEQVSIDQEMRSAYIDYSMSVIVSRRPEACPEKGAFWNGGTWS